MKSYRPVPLYRLHLAWLTLCLCACSSVVPPSVVKSNATLTPVSEVTLDLNRLPPPRQKIPVAVYGFRDQTGQFKPSPESLNSSQVSQGVSSVLVKALRDSGWYMPVEREGLQNLLTERRIIRAIEVPGEKGKPLIDLPNLTPASLVVEGGVIAYESNVRTGGKGANYLGIGSSNKYSVDQVTVGLRMIDIRNGQILNTVSVTKTIFSYAFGANHYAYVSYQKLLQAEIGYTTNEPAQLAVRQAVESAVIHLTVQGIRDRVLEMKDETQWNDPIIQSYIREQEEALAEVAEADDDDIPMRAVTPDGRVSPVLPLLVKETESTNTGRSGSTQTDSGGAKSLGTQAATKSTAGNPRSGNVLNKSPDKDDIFDTYRRLSN